MRFPKLRGGEVHREMLTVFRGYNAGDRIAEGEFANMENLTSDGYPLLSVRKKRGLYAAPAEIHGLSAKDGLCYVDGSKLCVNGYPVELGLSRREEDCPKQLVAMGAYLMIFPDKKYLNTVDLTDYGNLEAEFVTEGAVRFVPCTGDGTRQVPAYIQPEPPAEPEAMALWLDTSVEPNALMQWSAGGGMWVDAEQTFVRIEAPGIGSLFREGDGVTIEGAPEGVAEQTILQGRDEDFLIVPGLLAADTAGAGIRVSRLVPLMDHVIECGNRLWGCRYGLNRRGEVVNEIYASALGDFRNWNVFAGLSTDSYIMSLGADGAFTGAVQHLGYPVFFREGCLHKIYGNAPANFRLQTTPCRGVQRGSAASLAIVDEVLFYKSTGGVCAYDGSLPVEVSQCLGQEPYHSAAAGAYRGKYYISMADAGGEYHLFVYDRARNLWHREDGTQTVSFCACRDGLYFLDGAGAIRAVCGKDEDAVRWYAETGDLGLDSPDAKYISKLTLRLWLARGSVLRVFVRYDGQEKHFVAELRGTDGSVTLPMRVRRCDRLRLRLEGTGDAKLWSLTKTVEEGSDVF